MNAIRMGDWKLLINPSNGDSEEGGDQPATGKVELYNLADDLSERNDPASSNPEKVQELRARLDEFLKGAVAPDSVPSGKGKAGKSGKGKKMGKADSPD